MKARCSAHLSGDSATGLSVARVLALARKEADMRSLAQAQAAARKPRVRVATRAALRFQRGKTTERVVNSK